MKLLLVKHYNSPSLSVPSGNKVAHQILHQPIGTALRGLYRFFLLLATDQFLLADCGDRSTFVLLRLLLCPLFLLGLN